MAKAKMVPDGIDVSHHNGVIDWKKVKAAGIKFAMAKATDGSNFVDPNFEDNFKGMKNNGITAGAYHYLRGGHAADLQVANIEKTLKKVDFDATNQVLAIDVEEKNNEKVSADVMAETLQKVLTGLKNTYKKLYIFCPPSYWENQVSWKKYDFSQYPLWLSHHTQKSSPTIPTTWKDKSYVWWQYSQTGTVDGVKGSVDLDKSK
uniref:Lysozyme n=1 Tax=Cuerna arida TaxID=1464854 RepID=A0A1B6FUX2_9HEMI